MTRCTLLTAAVLACLASDRGRAADVAPADLEFFESKVRPVLVNQCGNCHSDAKKRGGLSLTSRDTMLKGGDSGPAVAPGTPEKSLLIQAISYKHDVKMPPKEKLPEAEIKVLTEWVARGAPWPATAVASGDGTLRANGTPITAADRAFWSFRPVTDPQPPTVKDTAWSKKPLDRFVLARLEAQNLRPVRPADKRTLIRRATFDLIGLPPTPEEIDAFLKDDSPEAFAKVVDRLLASPHYGERWGRHWLDVARYGEDQAHTFQARLYPQGWRYRDWVVKAFNDDMPYDRFITEQLAADLLSDGDPLQRIAALGLFALGPVYYRDAGEAGKAEAAEIDDRIDTLCRGVLGLTVACARCHDHKFDAISTQDYYALAGVFRSTKYAEAPLVPPAEAAKYAEVEAKVKAQEAAVKQFLDGETLRLSEAAAAQTAKYVVAAWTLHERRKTKPQSTAEAAKQEGLRENTLERWVKYLFEPDAAGRPTLANWRKALAGLDAKKGLSADVTTLATVQAAAEAFQKDVVAAVKENRRRNPLLQEVITAQGVFRIDPAQTEKNLDADAKKKLAELRRELETLKKNAPKPPTVHTLTEGTPADARIFVRGDPKKEGEVAPRRFLTVLAGDNAPRFTQGSGRLELAKAITSRDNPLTARVLVNRIWAHHFGRGIVTTPSNFGTLGAKPTHPELLDHLASRFMAGGWSVKALHREVMLSATYQLSGDYDENNTKTDAGNVWLWRMNRHRLDVESWRDAMLAVSGNLDPTLGGPSQELNNGNRRRTLYAAVSRHNLNGLLRLFDFPDPNITSETRTVTTVPLQQLFVLNSDFMAGQARALVKKLASEVDDSARVRKAYLLLYGRPATEDELKRGLAFVTPVGPTGGVTPWEQYAQVLLGANEFMYLD